MPTTIQAIVFQTEKTQAAYQITGPTGVEEIVANIATVEEAGQIVLLKAIQSRGKVVRLNITASIEDPKSAAEVIKAEA